MTTKETLESWYTSKKLMIEYDGRVCTSNCRREGCPHEEIHAEHLKEVFDTVSFEERKQIIKWLSNNDFEDTVREIYDEHCSDCWGTGEGEINDDGEITRCLCGHEAEQAADANASWTERK